MTTKEKPFKKVIAISVSDKKSLQRLAINEDVPLMKYIRNVLQRHIERNKHKI